jgi:hypothetical protein
MARHVLCDPALLMPVPDDEQKAIAFWRRLVEFSVDNRLRLGPVGYETVISLAGNFEWPIRTREEYPPGFSQLAERTFWKLLSKVLTSDAARPVPPPAIQPEHQRYSPAGAAIATDAAMLRKETLLGLASAPDHWPEGSEAVSFDPSPPKPLDLLFDACATTPAEVDHNVGFYLSKRRLTIVGGVHSDNLIARLNEHFLLEVGAIRWFQCEPGKGHNLDPLDGLQARVDVVYCVTGHIAHDGRDKARSWCEKRGIELRYVERPNQILDDLRRRHGDG